MHTSPQDFQLIDQAIASLSAPREAHIRLQQALQRIDADMKALQALELRDQQGAADVGKTSESDTKAIPFKKPE